MPKFPKDGQVVKLDGRDAIFECAGPDTNAGQCTVLVGLKGRRERVLTNLSALKWNDERRDAK